MNNNKNVLLAIALAAAVLFLWQYFVATPAMKAETARQEALTKQEKGKPPATASASGAPNLPGIAGTTPHMSRDAALKAGGARIAIDTPMVDGSILLKGAKLDDLRLKKYRETVDPKSAEIVVLAPKGTDYPYYATFGWVGGQAMPDDNSEWRQTSGGASCGFAKPRIAGRSTTTNSSSTATHAMPTLTWRECSTAKAATSSAAPTSATTATRTATRPPSRSSSPSSR